MPPTVPDAPMIHDVEDFREPLTDGVAVIAGGPLGVCTGEGQTGRLLPPIARLASRLKWIAHLVQRLRIIERLTARGEKDMKCSCHVQTKIH
jgi:hypothetical protein